MAMSIAQQRNIVAAVDRWRLHSHTVYDGCQLSHGQIDIEVAGSSLIAYPGLKVQTGFAGNTLSGALPVFRTVNFTQRCVNVHVGSLRVGLNSTA